MGDLGTKKGELGPKIGSLTEEKGTGKQHSKISLQSLNELQHPGPPQVVVHSASSVTTLYQAVLICFHLLLSFFLPVS